VNYVTSFGSKLPLVLQFFNTTRIEFLQIEHLQFRMCVLASCVDTVFIADSQLQTCGGLGRVIYQHQWNRIFQQCLHLSLNKLVIYQSANLC
jgi:hypothetical protein